MSLEEGGVVYGPAEVLEFESVQAEDDVDRLSGLRAGGYQKEWCISTITTEVSMDKIPVLERSRTCDADNEGIIRSQTWTNSHTQQSHQQALEKNSAASYFSEKRRFSLQLPSFQSLGISNIPFLSSQDSGVTEHRRSSETSSNHQSEAQTLLASAIHVGIAPPLTPPSENIPTVKPDFFASTTRSSIDSTNQSDHTDQESREQRRSSFGRISPIAMPESSSLADLSPLRKAPWMAEASQQLVSTLSAGYLQDQIHMTSQTLPCQAKDGRSRPTFEEVLETLQTEMESSPYITITHAVPLARSMDELPRTPPSTPNFRHDAHDYFVTDQTIFTHAAAVPIYHSHERLEANIAERSVHHIAAPCSVQVAILERYIPPTMPQEIDDLFSSSPRSYLADRLSELSTNNGSLLLIYPTRRGGNTFTSQFMEPIVDPHLRQFIMLNELTADAAALMGKMTAVSNMVEFAEMKNRITALCEKLSARSTAKGSRSAYSMTYSQTAEVALARTTWMNWFIEQEQSRFRQNLVEYHQAGGRMPQLGGYREVTVGMLTRDFIDGIQKSQQPAGDATIEVGVFLITRSRQ